MVRDTRFHRGRHAQRLVNPAKVVLHSTNLDGHHALKLLSGKKHGISSRAIVGVFFNYDRIT
jgi:hypothetical protein